MTAYGIRAFREQVLHQEPEATEDGKRVIHLDEKPKPKRRRLETKPATKRRRTVKTKS